MRIKPETSGMRWPTMEGGLRNRDGRPSDSFFEDPRKIVAGILTMAAAEKVCVPVATIHSILHEMKSREPILSKIHYSLTGDVCYSADVDKAIKDLIAWGSLELVHESAVIVKGFHPFRKQLSRSLTEEQLQNVFAASMRFYERVAEDPRGTKERWEDERRKAGKVQLPERAESSARSPDGILTGRKGKKAI